MWRGSHTSVHAFVCLKIGRGPKANSIYRLRAGRESPPCWPRFPNNLHAFPLMVLEVMYGEGDGLSIT